MAVLVIVSGVVALVGFLVVIKGATDLSVTRGAIGAVMLVVGLIGALAFAPSVHEDKSGKIVIKMVGLGDREIAAGSTDVELARLKLTADAAGDVTVKTVTITESFSGRNGSSRALCNVELWADQKKVSDSVYAANLNDMLVLYVLSLDDKVVVPAGGTIDLLLISDILSDVAPDSRHIIRPGSDTRDSVVVTDGKDCPVRVRWYMPHDWPAGHVITVVEPTAAKT